MALRRFLRDRRGASAVEFALIAGPFLLIMFGTIEFGRLLWARQVIEEIAIAGARCAGVVQPGCAVSGEYSALATRDFVVGLAAGRGLEVVAADVTATRPVACAGLQGFARVRVEFTFQSPIPEFSRLLAKDGRFAAEACFPVQS